MGDEHIRTGAGAVTASGSGTVEEGLLHSLRRAAATMEEAGIEFALAGGFAAHMRGAAVSTHDVDFALRPRDAEPALEDACPLARVLANESAEEVRRALARLAPHYRDALILYELHGLSYAEIATICAVDIGTVRSRLARGRAALAKALRLHALERS